MAVKTKQHQTVSSAQERQQLNSSIWKAADTLRGSVDGWDFKAYILGMIFYRFASENLTEFLNKSQREAGEADFDYTKLSDELAEYGREDTVDDLGYFLLPSQLFQNVADKADKNADLNETLKDAFDGFEGSAVGHKSEATIKGLFGDLDVNSSRLGSTVAQRNKLLARIMKEVAGFPLGSLGEKNNDTFGDAYEFLMTMYASKAGKSGGEFFTPQSVSELVAKISASGREKLRRVYETIRADWIHFSADFVLAA
ncbi:type I restriction-modification system subunit M [Actinomyces minihominis]|uniref:type I restriction-modification system subunit M n=1 Tax=Actinomyces minihominis TaxID=2002838 RepID=UPI0013EAC356|nr:type I restriction-modification system subunit M [Actinomyces minihominis]